MRDKIRIRKVRNEFLAELLGANIATMGETEEEARTNLESLIRDYWEDLSSTDLRTLGPEPRRQLEFLRGEFRKLGSVDVKLVEHHPPGLTGGLHAMHGDPEGPKGLSLWYAAALLSAAGVEGKSGQKLRITVESLDIECTGLSAAWCPVHGDCTCDRERDMEDESCPLHSMESDHGEPV